MLVVSRFNDYRQRIPDKSILISCGVHYSLVNCCFGYVLLCNCVRRSLFVMEINKSGALKRLIRWPVSATVLEMSLVGSRGKAR